MTSRNEFARPVNPPPAFYVRGQSLRILASDAIGVVVNVRGSTYELAVWPCARVEAHASGLAPLTSSDACLRSLGMKAHGDIELLAAGFASIIDGTARRCQPRARDGRCHWCDRQLDELHIDDENDREVSRG